MLVQNKSNKSNKSLSKRLGNARSQLCVEEQVRLQTADAVD